MKAGLGNSWAGNAIKAKWKKLLKQHNRLRVSLNKLRRQREISDGSRSFKRDPHRFASKIFNDSKNAKPNFSREKATEYFSKTYRDEERCHEYIPLPEFSRPSSPQFLFDERCPSLQELKVSVRKKASKAAPDINSLSYLPYQNVIRSYFLFTKL